MSAKFHLLASFHVQWQNRTHIPAQKKFKSEKVQNMTIQQTLTLKMLACIWKKFFLFVIFRFSWKKIQCPVSLRWIFAFEDWVFNNNIFFSQTCTQRPDFQHRYLRIWTCTSSRCSWVYAIIMSGGKVLFWLPSRSVLTSNRHRSSHYFSSY